MIQRSLRRIETDEAFTCVEGFAESIRAVLAARARKPLPIRVAQLEFRRWCDCRKQWKQPRSSLGVRCSARGRNPKGLEESALHSMGNRFQAVMGVEFVINEV